MPDDVKSKINELEKELYSKKFEAHPIEDTLARKEISPAPSWKELSDEEKTFKEEEARRHHIMKKFVLISAGFFVFETGYDAAIRLKGGLHVSKFVRRSDFTR